MSDIILLDGGMGQELLARSSQPPSPLWSARVLLDEPDIVQAVHEDYLAAGATVLTLNTYSVTPERLARDADEDLFLPLQQRALELAHRARDRSGRTAAIAGCLPPLVASFRPDVVPDDATALDTYRRIVTAQDDGVDLFLCETLSSVREVRAAATAAAESGKPVWVAVTLQDENPQDLSTPTLRSGEPLHKAVDTCLELGIQARLINCCRPEAITAAWSVFSAAAGVTGAYANGFTSIAALQPGGTVDALEARHDLPPAAYADFAMTWVDGGARIVGGCCEVGPEHIRTLAERLREGGHDIICPG